MTTTYDNNQRQDLTRSFTTCHIKCNLLTRSDTSKARVLAETSDSTKISKTQHIARAFTVKEKLGTPAWVFWHYQYGSYWGLVFANFSKKNSVASQQKDAQSQVEVVMFVHPQAVLSPGVISYCHLLPSMISHFIPVCFEPEITGSQSNPSNFNNCAINLWNPSKQVDRNRVSMMTPISVHRWLEKLLWTSNWIKQTTGNNSYRISRNGDSGTNSHTTACHHHLNRYLGQHTDMYASHRLIG